MSYHRPARRLGWVDYGRVLDEFGGDTREGRRRYREFVADGVGRAFDSPLSRAVHGLVLGSDAFVERVRDLAASRGEDREVPTLTRLRRRPSVEEVAAAVAERWGVDRSSWSPGRRDDGVARPVAAYLARRLTGAPSRAIAAALGYRNVSSITVACRRVEAAPPRAPLAREARRLLRSLAGVR